MKYMHHLQTGLAIGKMLVSSFTDNILTAIESFEEHDGRIYRARFGDPRELLSSSNGGFTLTGTEEGCISRAVSYENVMVFGAIGSGKTAGLAIPSLMSIERASIICTDPSGQIRSKVAKYMESRGFRVLVLKFDSPHESNSFNVFNYIKTKSDAYKVAFVLVSCILKVGTGDNFWFLQAQTMIYVFISIVMSQKEEVRNMTNVRHLLNRFSVKPESLDKLFLKCASLELFEDWLSINRMEEKVLKSVIATAQSALGLWFDENVARTTCMNDIDFLAMRSTPTVLFIENPTANSKVYAPIISLVFEMAFKTLMSRLPSGDDLDVFMILDEVGTLRLESLGDILNNNRKYKISIMTLWQSPEIIEHQFGVAEAESIKNASRTKVFLSGMGLKASADLQELLGKEEYVDSDGKVKVKPLMLAQDIRLMKPEDAIIISGNLEPLKVKISPYFKQPLLELKLNLPPFQVRNNRIPQIIPLILLP